MPPRNETKRRIEVRVPLVIASHNAGKVREIGELVAPYFAPIRSAADLALPEPRETGETFLENASLKARAAAFASGCVALADDSGLTVDALDGAPGVLSARWAGPERDFQRAMARLNTALGDGERTAQMHCALALAWPDGHVEAFEGKVVGTLVWPVRGTNGFGYEPMFVPESGERTYAEMPRSEKLVDDPRARAFEVLHRECLMRVPE